MNKLILISVVKNIKKREFHFRGFYRGILIKKVEVDEMDYRLELDEVYLVYLKDARIFGHTLSASVSKIKKLTEVNF